MPRINRKKSEIDIGLKPEQINPVINPYGSRSVF